MGGFVLVDPERKTTAPNEQQHTVLTLDYFKAHKDVEIPKITAAAIEDRSKGDALSKIIAILQTTWFIVQCVARGQQRLALTELELVTLALASLNAVTFAIWWHKPLGVQDPVKIYFRVETEIKRVEEVSRVGVPYDTLRRLIILQRDDHISFNEVFSKGWGLVKLTSIFVPRFFANPCYWDAFLGIRMFLIDLPILLICSLTLPFFVLFPLGTVLLLKVIKTEPASQDAPLQNRGLLANRMVTALQTFRYRLTSDVSKFVGDKVTSILEEADSTTANRFFVFVFGWFILLPLLFLFFTLFVILLIPFFTLFLLLSFTFTAVFGIVTTSFIPRGASHVPSFYAPNTPSDRWSRMVVFALFGVIFGGLHCIGWNFDFPTHPEQSLWRSTSLAIAVIPLVVAPIDFLLAARLRIRDINSCVTSEKVALLALDLVMTILLFVYVPARLSLIAQALALLRSQPASALTAVDWTKYVPHLFSS